jgi:chromosome segregation ATPase
MFTQPGVGFHRTAERSFGMVRPDFMDERRDWFRTKDSLQFAQSLAKEFHPMTNEELLTRIETLLDDRFGVVNRQFEIIDGKFKTVDERFDQLSGQFNGLTGQVNGLTHRFDDLSGQVNGLTGQVNGLSSRFDQLNNRFDELHAELISTRDVLEARIATLEVRFDNLENRFDGLETRFDRLENRVEGVRVELKQDIRETRQHLEAEIGRAFSAIIETHRDVKLTRRRVREIENETLTRIEQLEQRVERLEAGLSPQG